MDQRGLDTRDVLYGFGSVVLDGLPPLVKAVRMLGDEFLVVEAIVDQAVGKGVEERNIATVLDRKVEIGDTRGFDMARVATMILQPFSLARTIRLATMGCESAGL